MTATGHHADVSALFGVPVPDRPLREDFDAALAEDEDGARRFETGIPMRDGVELAADVYLPAKAQLPAPAVVFGTPYDKSMSALNAIEVELYQQAGYVAVAYDVRGRGKSEGEWRAFVNDPNDGHDVVEWVAAQDWCTGRVGVSGVSYGGWITWAAASQRPPHLAAIISTSAAGRWMEEIPYTHGCFQLYFAYWVASVRRRVLGQGFDLRQLLQTLPVDDIADVINPSGRTWRDLLDHDTLDDHWRALRFDERYDQIDVPVLHVTGWHDLEDLQGAFHHYEHMVAASPARDHQWLIVGPWSHVMCRWPGHEYGGVRYDRQAAVDMHGVHLRFFDRFLRADDNGVDTEPRVRLFDTGADRWTTPDAWATETTERELYLDADGELAAAPGAAGSSEYRYDPEDPPTHDFDVSAPVWEPPLDLGPLEQRADVLVFTTEPLSTPLTVHGWSFMELFAATDGDDTDWFVKLADVTPDERSLKVAGGCLRAACRNSLTKPEPVPPGEVVRYRVELTPALHTFATGHRVRLSVTSAEFPWFARNLNRFGPIRDQRDPRVARNTVHFGADHASRLLLPVVVGKPPHNS